jgi:hypothetical protein
VFTNDQQQLYIRRSPMTANPASVCVTQGSTTERFTVGTTGGGLPAWTPDS